METDEERVRELVAEAGAVLRAYGLVDWLGHVSARVGNGFVIKPKFAPSISALDTIGAGDLLLMSSAGQVLEGHGNPPSEVAIHTAIYRARPDVGAVIHTHQKAATTLGIIGCPVLPLLHVPATYIREEDVGIWPSALLVTSPDLGDSLAEALGERSCCHLQGHGVVVVGASLEEAVVRAMVLEELAEANLAVLATGMPPRTIPEAEVAQLREHRVSPEQRYAVVRSAAGIV